jgi:Zn-dependent peptidase ImmA (M78 family)
MRRSKIQAIIEKLLTDCGITEAPIPVYRIAKACGARISVDFLEGDLSGFLYRDNKLAVIGVNTRHPQVRQNFTVAHELGHLLLHDRAQLQVDHEFHVRLRNDLSSKGTSESKREANFFAASLLMPKKFLEKDLGSKEYVDLCDDSFLHGLARKYGVSAQALVNRLKNLGYIGE